MSLSSIASQLYSIQTKKKVPLKTAFTMLIREDLASRFSVYNLTRIITKSEFLATAAQTAFGKRTPLQRKQDEEEDKFKQYTISSITSMKKSIALLTSISERNSSLINNLYSELGSFRTQRRININTFNSSSIKIPATGKTVKAQIEKLNQEIDELKKIDKKKSSTGVSAKKTTKKEQEKDQSNFLSKFIPSLLRSPTGLAILAGGASRAIGLGSIAARAYSMYKLPQIVGNVASRFSGKQVQNVSPFVNDDVVAAAGTYSATRMITGATSLLKDYRQSKLTPLPAAEAKKQMINDVRKKIQGKQTGSSAFFESKQKATKSVNRYIKMSTQLKKFKLLEGALKSLTKRFPALQAATIAYDISKMSNTIANRSSGNISQEQFRSEMIGNYDTLIDDVGIPAMGAVMGGLAGTALFPGIGTLGGAMLGGTIFSFGQLISKLFSDADEDKKVLATKIYEIIHEDKPHKPKPPPDIQAQDKEQPKSNPQTSSISTKDGFAPSVGTLGGMPLKSIPPETQKILNTIAEYESRKNYKAVTSMSSASGAYQFIDSTWREQAKAAGIGTEYPSAYLAPPQIQDAVAANYVNRILRQPDVNGDVSKIPLVWFTGNAQGKRTAAGDAANPTVSVAKYQADWMQIYNKGKSTAQMMTTPMPLIVSPQNVVAEKPPTESTTRSENKNSTDVQAQIDAKAALTAVESVNKKVIAVANQASTRIQKLEKFNPADAPGYKHNDSSLSGYVMNA